MLVRYLNIAAVGALILSAIYAYSIKYETILYLAKTQKIENSNERMRVEIGLLKAEWAHLTRPERIQTLADAHLDLQQLQLDQIVAFQDLPERPPKTDSIGRKLKELGLLEPTATPRAPDGVGSGATTNAAAKRGTP